MFFSSPISRIHHLDLVVFVCHENLLFNHQMSEFPGVGWGGEQIPGGTECNLYNLYSLHNFHNLYNFTQFIQLIPFIQFGMSTPYGNCHTGPVAVKVAKERFSTKASGPKRLCSASERVLLSQRWLVTAGGGVSAAASKAERIHHREGGGIWIYAPPPRPSSPLLRGNSARQPCLTARPPGGLATRNQGGKTALPTLIKNI